MFGEPCKCENVHGGFCHSCFMDACMSRINAVKERDKWRDIAERLYNASQETDYSLMVKASRAYEEAASEREEG